MENDEELIEISDFEVGHKDGNCRAYKKAQKQRKLPLSMFCVIFMKLIVDKMKELMRRHDVMLVKEDDD